MIVYLDASALVKRYVAERGTRETAALTADADLVATSLVSRAEVAAALSKAVRLRILTAASGRTARRAFASDWADIARIDPTEALLLRAEQMAWSHALRGYDAVHLASAFVCQDLAGVPVTLATFDRQLWLAGREAGIDVWPAEPVS